MLVYEYLPHEIARLSVVRKAAGLDGEQVDRWVGLAGERQEHARQGPAELLRLSEALIAAWGAVEWERIARVMTEQHMTVYCPEQDSRVARRERERLERLAVEVGKAGAEGVVMQCHRVYRVDARPTAGSGNDAPLTAHLMASSLSEAAHLACTAYGREGGLYHKTGYRISSVRQVLPEPGELL